MFGTYTSLIPISGEAAFFLGEILLLGRLSPLWLWLRLWRRRCFLLFLGWLGFWRRRSCLLLLTTGLRGCLFLRSRLFRLLFRFLFRFLLLRGRLTTDFNLGNFLPNSNCVFLLYEELSNSTGFRRIDSNIDLWNGSQLLIFVLLAEANPTLSVSIVAISSSCST